MVLGYENFTFGATNNKICVYVFSTHSSALLLLKSRNPHAQNAIYAIKKIETKKHAEITKEIAKQKSDSINEKLT